MNRRTWLRQSGAGLAGLVGAQNVASGNSPSSVTEESPVVLPHPQSVIFGSARFQLINGAKLNVSIESEPAAGPEAAESAQMIADELARRTGQRPNVSSVANPKGFAIRLSGFKGTRSGKETEVEGGYRIRIDSHGAQLESRGAGFRYAAATLVQLLEGGKSPRLREVEIRDWPAFPWRAIYVEVTSGACMSLTDWKELIEWAAYLKLNAVVAGLYNCWQRPISVLDAEYFLFPSHKYPEFKTPVRTYSKQGGRMVERTGLPAMYREDFFAQVVAYGQRLGVMVCPYFSSLSHNTLIPRIIPEISMKDEQCRPTGYGFCTTSPKTYEVLFGLYDEIIERFAKPYGITTFHVGMDEVGQACQCPNCGEAWKGEDNFYVNHLIKISRHLKERGMTRVLAWHDMLHRGGLINKDLESRLKAEGLEGLIALGWWYYGAPREGFINPRSSFGRSFFRPKIGLEAWGCPSAGWDTTQPLGASNWTANQALVRLARQAKDRGANGVISYSNHDPMFEAGYVNLSQYAWNPAPALAETQERNARRLFGADHARGSQALKTYQDIYGIYASLTDAFYRRPGPPALGQALASMGGEGLQKARFEQSVQALASAASTLGEIQTRVKNPAKARVVGMYRVEIRRLGAFLRMALAVFECTEAYDHLRSERDAAALSGFSERLRALRESLVEHGTVMRELEDQRFTPSLPRFMAHETKAQEDVQQFIKVFTEMERRGRNGEMSYLPEIVIAGENFFATHIGMVLS